MQGSGEGGNKGIYKICPRVIGERRVGEEGLSVIKYCLPRLEGSGRFIVQLPFYLVVRTIVLVQSNVLALLAELTNPF